MPSYSFLALFPRLLFSFLLFLLIPLVLFPSSSISTFSTAVVLNNASSYSYKPLPSTPHPPHHFCIHQHLSALLQLKRGFNLSDSFTDLSSWNANNPDCCFWEGIHCNPFTGHVISLNLSRLFIGGLLDFQSLFQIRSLERLDLSYNHEFVESPIPSGFAQLSNLTHLYLSRSNFYGQIPPDIFHLTRLVSLDLSYNEYYNVSNKAMKYLYLERSSFGMQQLFGNLSGLRKLFLDFANLSAMGTQWSRILALALPNLQQLSLSSCNLFGSIHPSLFRLHSLALLYLSNNHLSFPLSGFILNLTLSTSSVNLSQLGSLDLSRNNFQGPIPIWIFELTELQSLRLSSNHFDGVVDLGSFQYLKNLASLDLSSNYFSAIINTRNSSFSSTQPNVNLGQLQSLELSGNNFQGPIPIWIFELTELQSLRLSSNHFDGVVDLGSFQYLKNLASLDLSSNYFSAIINTRNSSFSSTQPNVNLGQLQSLELSGNKFQGPIPIFIFELTKLQSLFLSWNHFDGVVDLGSFQYLKNLASLDLSSNYFSAIINTRNSSFSSTQPNVNLGQLRSLELSKNNFQGPIPIFIFELTELQSLFLSWNHFDGVVDLGSFQFLKNLASLDLSYNYFSAIINTKNSSFSSTQPNVNLGQLRSLELSGNNFQGPIPIFIFELTELQSLFLSWNDFDGVVDLGSFQFLKNLASLDLSYNYFSAIINTKNSSFSSTQPNVNLGQLRSLELSGNNFQGPIPIWIFELTELQSLRLSSNHFDGVVDLGSFQYLKNLASLDLSSNYFSAIINTRNSSFSSTQPNVNLGQLQSLELSGNKFQGPIPIFIFELTELQSLFLSRNHFDGVVDLGSFQYLKNLASLDLSYNYFSAIINTRNSSFSSTQPNVNLGQLRSLELSKNNFQGPIPIFIFELTELQSLFLSRNYFDGVVDLGSFQFLKNLASLDLSSNYFSAIINTRNSSFSSTQPNVNLGQLRSLELSGNNFQGPIPIWIFELTELQSLRLSSNHFDGVVDLGSFQYLKNLASLDLSSNYFSAIINTRNSSFSSTQPNVNLGQLQSLELSGNKFQGPIPIFIFELTELQSLFLSWNHFDGVVDLGSFQYLKNLASLDLSSNYFSAIINTRNSSFSSTQPNVNLGQLRSLELSKNNFQGPIPIWIFELTELQSLRLSSNHFDGVVDLGSFQNLKNLARLYLSSNYFSAIIDTRNSSFSSTLPNVNLGQLIDLDLSRNNFQGPIPTWIFELTELEILQLSSNHFNGLVDLGLLLNVKNLRFLDLSDNNLTVTSDLKSNLMSMSFPQVNTLYLRSCGINNFPDMLRNQEWLEVLDLSRNRIHGKIPQWVWEIGNGSIQYLNLSDNALEGLEGPFPHLFLTSMKYFDLSSNLLKGSILMPPATSTFFSLANNKLDGEVPSLICGAKFLEALDLSSNNFTGLVPQCLGKISNGIFKVLNLGKNAFHGPLFQTFKVGCVLETLVLNDNYLEGQMPRSLTNCQMLTVLNLGNNQIQDEFPSQLGNLSNLRVLVLRSNNFFGPIRVPWTSREFFPQLQIIDLSFNNFNGRLPSNLFSTWKMMKDGSSASNFLTANISGYYQDKVSIVWKGTEYEFVKILMAITIVDLSHNQFHGDIPTSIEELKALHVLNLSRNYFQGEIPASLQNLKELESLDLSNNNLSGKIPWQLAKLSFLAVLNLSENQLTGKIPQGRHFDTFENGSFLGNSELCGLPLSRKCEEDTIATPSATQSNDKESELNLMWIAFGVGHGVGFGMFFWTMALWRRGRRAFFMFVDRVFFRVFFYYVATYACVL